MISLLGVDFGEGAARIECQHPATDGPIFRIAAKAIAPGRIKLDIQAQRTALLAQLLARFPNSLLRWKGTPPADMTLGAFAKRGAHTFRIPADAPADKVRALVAAGEWLIYATPSGKSIGDEYLDIWDDLKQFWMLGRGVEYFIGSKVGDDPWRFFIRPQYL